MASGTSPKTRTWLHGDDFLIALPKEDLDWVTQKPNEKHELVQKARLGPGHDIEELVLDR